ncbi:MAG TPA: CBS domain-containing protein, partial [Acidimicrobiia bacterium]|nr:CBS domain-containing protein [Acidimicrobiia bacterium]
EAALQLHESDIGALAVESDGVLHGIFTERDLTRAVASGAELDTALIEDWMTPYPDSFGPDMSVETAATWMLAAGYRHLPVVEGQDVIGMISMKDILWALTEPTLV